MEKSGFRQVGKTHVLVPMTVRRATRKEDYSQATDFIITPPRDERGHARSVMRIQLTLTRKAPKAGAFKRMHLQRYGVFLLRIRQFTDSRDTALELLRGAAHGVAKDVEHFGLIIHKCIQRFLAGDLGFQPTETQQGLQMPKSLRDFCTTTLQAIRKNKQALAWRMIYGYMKCLKEVSPYLRARIVSILSNRGDHHRLSRIARALATEQAGQAA